MDKESMRELIKDCKLQNECAGIAEFRQFSKLYASDACEIGWWKISELPDEDEGGAICEVLNVIANTDSQWTMNQIMITWPTLDDERRSSITTAANSRGILPVQFWIALFRHRSSRVRDRHHLFAALVRGDYKDDVRPYVNELIASVGRYDDEWRDAIMNDFLDGVRKSYAAT